MPAVRHSRKLLPIRVAQQDYRHFKTSHPQILLSVGGPISAEASLFIFSYGANLNDPTNPAWSDGQSPEGVRSVD